ncbi:ATP synthase F0 subunit B [Candidatus Curtissbacteria bacterium RBG_13_35_7]|uniref:ATP synthase subunit b n=1 Tax=Candidatus Curtissbacteria bacterium RBG_13_35_7 TaxID=1797705 RepID=A0A1F5G1E0_9BACT|nr:MAG: ATP synthase F0 subunit B [Candidatus Curtissbacteria bacterium RBG_13_35_7]
MEIFENFGIQPTLLLAQIVNFLIILFLLKKFFYKPILKVLDERKSRIEESLKNADLIEEKLKKTEEKSALILQDTQKNAQELIDNAKKEAGNIQDQASKDARKTIEEAIIEAKKQIEAQRLEMQNKLEKETVGLVADVVKKVLRRNLKPQEKQDLTKSAISEISKQL